MHFSRALVMGDGVLCYGASEIVGLLLLLLSALRRQKPNPIYIFITHNDQLVGVDTTFVLVCLQHNSKANNPKVFKLGVGNDLEISSK